MTSTRVSTCARPISRRARSGPAGTRSRRTSGRLPTATPPLTAAQRQALADQLVADTAELHEPRPRPSSYTAAQLGNGAKELLDEVATGKVTGEEEAWSHTDLWDFQANVDGAHEAFAALQPIVAVKDPELAATLTARFAGVFRPAGRVPRR